MGSTPPDHSRPRTFELTLSLDSDETSELEIDSKKKRVELRASDKRRPRSEQQDKPLNAKSRRVQPAHESSRRSRASVDSEALSVPSLESQRKWRERFSRSKSET